MRKKAWDMIAMTTPREWCSTGDQFSNGGLRSGQDALGFGNNENKANAGAPNTELEEEVVVQKIIQGEKRFAIMYDPLVQVEVTASKPQKRSRAGQVVPDVERHRKMHDFKGPIGNSWPDIVQGQDGEGSSL